MSAVYLQASLRKSPSPYMLPKNKKNDMVMYGKKITQ
jgi:hypothetical protein